MRTFVIATTSVYLMFIVWVIYMADTGASTVFFDFVRRVPCGDSIGHVLLFGFLTLGLNVSLGYKSLPFRGIALQLGSVLVLAFTCLEELAQWQFPTRTFDLVDMVANVVGVALFSWISIYLQGLQRNS